MKTRLLKNIKVKGDKIRFEHEDLYFDCSYTSADIEAIYYYDGVLHFNPSKSSQTVQVCNATEKDFEILKKLISKSENFVCCGKEYIFSLKNVKSYEEDEKFLDVYCNNDFYEIFISKEEDVKDFVLAMQRRLNQNIEV